MPVNQAVSFVYESTQAGTSHAVLRTERKEKLFNTKLR